MPDQTPAQIAAACLAAVADRDPRIVAALDLIESISNAIDNATTDALRLELAFGALDSVQHMLSQPPRIVSQ